MNELESILAQIVNTSPYVEEMQKQVDVFNYITGEKASANILTVEMANEYFGGKTQAQKGIEAIVEAVDPKIRDVVMKLVGDKAEKVGNLVAKMRQELADELAKPEYDDAVKKASMDDARELLRDAMTTFGERIQGGVEEASKDLVNAIRRTGENGEEQPDADKGEEGGDEKAGGEEEPADDAGEETGALKEGDPVKGSELLKTVSEVVAGGRAMFDKAIKQSTAGTQMTKQSRQIRAMMMNTLVLMIMAHALNKNVKNVQMGAEGEEKADTQLEDFLTNFQTFSYRETFTLGDSAIEEGIVQTAKFALSSKAESPGKLAAFRPEKMRQYLNFVMKDKEFMEQLEKVFPGFKSQFKLQQNMALLRKAINKPDAEFIGKDAAGSIRENLEALKPGGALYKSVLSKFRQVAKVFGEGVPKSRAFEKGKKAARAFSRIKGGGTETGGAISGEE